MMERHDVGAYMKENECNKEGRNECKNIGTHMNVYPENWVLKRGEERYC